MPLGYWPGSSSALTVSPVRVVVAAIVCTMTSWLVSGRPRQFIEMWENSRCSIWGEMRTAAGARQPAGAVPWPRGIPAGGYVAVAASCTV